MDFSSNFSATFFVLLETIAGVLLFIAGYVAVLFLIIICAVLADLVYEAYRLAHSDSRKGIQLDRDFAARSKGGRRGWSQWVRHTFQH